MKKVLLIGNLGEIVRSLNECLADEYQVQLCSKEVSNVQAMVKIVKPELIISCHVESGESDIDNSIFTWLHKKCQHIPVLGITTNEGWLACSDFYKCEQFDVLFRPVLKSDLLRKCRQMLFMDDKDGNEVQEEAIDIGRKKILLVDDSGIVLRKMKSMLEDKFEICLAKSGEQALKVIQKEMPDLVLLDYEMAGMDGKATFEKMKEDEMMKDIPVVFLTSISDRKAICSVLKSKPDGYILKPPNEELILKTINDIFVMQNKKNRVIL